MHLKLDLFHLQQCWIQARVFERADKAGYDMCAFAAAFMDSEAAEGLDADYDRMQWAGEAYILESVVRAAGLKPDAAAPRFDREAIFWAGFIYRFWNFKTGETSRAIYTRAPFEEVLTAYPGLHTLDNNRAVEELATPYPTRPRVEALASHGEEETPWAASRYHATRRDAAGTVLLPRHDARRVGYGVAL